MYTRLRSASRLSRHQNSKSTLKGIADYALRAARDSRFYSANLGMIAAFTVRILYFYTFL